MNISKNFSLKNKIAIITGGNGLLGSTYSYGLHEAGSNLIVDGALGNYTGQQFF